MTALDPKADIRLILAVMTANDPKQTFKTTVLLRLLKPLLVNMELD